MDSNEKILKYISKRLYELRNQKNFSARGMSLDLGHGNSYLTMIENLQRTPSISALEEICTFLGISLSEFFAEYEADDYSLNKREANIKLGVVLKSIREKKGLSINKLSKMINLSSYSINNIENGVLPISVEILAQYLKPMGIKLSEFFLSLEQQKTEELEPTTTGIKLNKYQKELLDISNHLSKSNIKAIVSLIKEFKDIK